MSQSEELLRLVVHGALHLLGYTDASSTERRRMETLQEEIVGKFLGSLRH